MEKWFVAAKKADFQQIAEKFHIDQVTARIIRNRDIVGDAAIAEYLSGGREHLHPAALLGGCREAACLLRKKLRERKKIRIIGDYDIDGVNATYILYKGLKRLGAEVDYEIPDRMKDGYGLNIQLIDLAYEEGADTILTCDNGISAIEQIAHAKELGMTVIVTDHHEPLFSYKGEDSLTLAGDDPTCAVREGSDTADQTRGSVFDDPTRAVREGSDVADQTHGSVFDDPTRAVREGSDAADQTHGSAFDDPTRAVREGPDCKNTGRADTQEESDGPAVSKILRLPPADALIDPRLPYCPYPFKKLCGAAVAWKLIQMLYEVCGVPVSEADEFLQYVGIATVGDVMDLTGENRILVKLGLQALMASPNPGLKALIRATGLEGSALTAYHIGFVIGPCINAGGRLDTAKRSLKLLLSEDPQEATTLAQELKVLNDERKELTSRGVEQASELIETTDLDNDRVLVIYLPDCHESIAGIVAGRIRERYHRPTFILTKSADGIKGSGRSIEAYSMFDELVKCQELLTKFGGHPMAAGLSMEPKNLPVFRRKVNELCALTGDDLAEKVTIDVPMPIDYLTESLIEEFHLLEPFGKENPKPLFAEKNLSLLRATVLGKHRNVLKFQVRNTAGRTMDALYFGDIDAMRNYLRETYGASETEKLFQGRENMIHLSVTYYPSVNEFRGFRTLQIVIQNYR